MKASFAGLCAALSTLGVWVRLHYVYPYPHVDEVLPLMAEGRLLPYLDIPFQHGSPRLLKLMRRPAAAENTLARIAAWRAVCPTLTLRSTFIVGFPGETEADFATLLEFLTGAQIDRAGCFEYSPVAGASANDLPDPVPAALKAERYARFMETQQAISRQRLAQKVGREIEVLVDGQSERGAVARSAADAPEIDGLVYVNNARRAKAGDLLRVRVTGADDYDLSAQRLSRK